ncbi:hypothetical protein GUJ93_ZPchr0001g32291 [Zizania palustris]|uniref:Uncharacterized protein n=1 Tax=Zizania palustris TaxID=103762 RepID=A0A8J5RFJ4_ZIZPA|nr:hypothetical protein GUJ93_ZPchr0001g32291 [Zizania palustris]
MLEPRVFRPDAITARQCLRLEMRNLEVLSRRAASPDAWSAAASMGCDHAASTSKSTESRAHAATWLLADACEHATPRR